MDLEHMVVAGHNRINTAVYHQVCLALVLMVIAEMAVLATDQQVIEQVVVQVLL